MGERKKELQPRGEEESLMELAKPIIPLAAEYFTERIELIKQQTQMAQTQAGNMLELQKDALRIEDGKDKRRFVLALVLLVPIVLVVLGTAVGLIFYKGNDQAGVLLLTHVIALVVGVIGGAGYQRLRQPDKPK